MDGDMIARLGYLGLLIVAVGGYLLVEFRGRMGQLARGVMSWGLIFVGVMAGYGLWQDMGGQYVGGQTVTADAVTLPRANDGHYYVTLDIDGTDVDFMIDTGASNVVLTRGDAQRLGIDPAGLAYLGTAQTANGSVRIARVMLENVTLGGFVDDALPAYVNEGEMFGSLLGMDYLRHFRVEIADGQMILRR
ncbi:aspartyl protease family protein [Pseudorhodobacter antarcticus]|jgi:aspartyl protease family protein|uniref:Aspartyl protease family protein n=1 Tax=Pseudorhodobacter antarcticus TaxID=1077947 RepID=A0A1H8BGQ6_9RHOB|nr:TIGR02281 family clan AA aspartic protease [Pseudorhodobacter antarcticus]SEM82035.1 aspartyl protease family protein [Pseudorhodobacter antarcticus]